MPAHMYITGIQVYMPLCPRAYAGICADICVDISHLVFPIVFMSAFPYKVLTYPQQQQKIEYSDG